MPKAQLNIQGFFFFLNNYKSQTILLVSNVSKLFRKLTTRVCETRFYCSKSNLKDSISIRCIAEVDKKSTWNLSLKDLSSLNPEIWKHKPTAKLKTQPTSKNPRKHKLAKMKTQTHNKKPKKTQTHTKFWFFNCRVQVLRIAVGLLQSFFYPLLVVALIWINGLQ